MRFKLTLQAATASICFFMCVAFASTPLAKEQIRDPKPLREGSNIYVEETLSAFPDISFMDEKGKTHRISGFKSHLTLVNFWATWCTPCVHEMPYLNALQERYETSAFQVLPISEDRKGFDAIAPFFKRNKLKHLTPYLDEGGVEFRKLKMRGLPMSFLLDKKGQLIATIQGEADWLGEDILQLIERHIGQHNKP